VSFTHSHQFTIEAPVERVFRALVDPSDLTKWFAEEVQVEPRVGGVYRFWGRHTLGTPAHDAARQTVTVFEPSERLGFTWPIDEVDTDVTLTLAPHEKGTALSLEHRVYGDLKVPRASSLIEDLWLVAIGNLTKYLGGDAVSLPDYFAQR
jgi:uncharacterized protein YndB with AHSA1/START domain